MSVKRQVRWSEVRILADGSPERFFWIGEETNEGWTFYERSEYELKWYPVAGLPGLEALALEEEAKQESRARDYNGQSIGSSAA